MTIHPERAGPRPGPLQPIGIVLTGPPTGRVGEQVPIRVHVRNLLDRPLAMVGVLEGSEAGVRFPRWMPRIAGPVPLGPPPELAWCGIVAPLRPADVRQLAPGEGFDPTEATGGAGYEPLLTFQQFRPPAPGRYAVSLTLSTLSDSEEDWLGLAEYPDKDAALRRLRAVPRLEVASEALGIEVA